MRPSAKDDQPLRVQRSRTLDPELSAAVEGELTRQRVTLDLVASESVPPRAVLEAQGSMLTAKYADGYPGSRDYDTCDRIDEIESPRDRAREVALRCRARQRAALLGGERQCGGAPRACASRATPCSVSTSPMGATRASTRRRPSPGATTAPSPTTCAGRTGSWTWTRSRRSPAATARRCSSPAGRATAGTSTSRAFREIADEVGAALVVDMAHFAGPCGRQGAP